MEQPSGLGARLKSRERHVARQSRRLFFFREPSLYATKADPPDPKTREVFEFQYEKARKYSVHIFLEVFWQSRHFRWAKSEQNIQYLSQSDIDIHMGPVYTWILDMPWGQFWATRVPLKMVSRQN